MGVSDTPFYWNWVCLTTRPSKLLLLLYYSLHRVEWYIESTRLKHESFDTQVCDQSPHEWEISMEVS